MLSEVNGLFLMEQRGRGSIDLGPLLLLVLELKGVGKRPGVLKYVVLPTRAFGVLEELLTSQQPQNLLTIPSPGRFRFLLSACQLQPACPGECDFKVYRRHSGPDSTVAPSVGLPFAIWHRLVDHS